MTRVVMQHKKEFETLRPDFTPVPSGLQTRQQDVTGLVWWMFYTSDLPLTHIRAVLEGFHENQLIRDSEDLQPSAEGAGLGDHI